MNAKQKLEALGYSGRAADAAALVIDDGLSRQAAARQIGVDPAAVTRLLNKFTKTTVCKCCGGESKEVKL